MVHIYNILYYYAIYCMSSCTVLEYRRGWVWGLNCHKTSEPKFVNLLRSPGIDSQSGGIDSLESILFSNTGSDRKPLTRAAGIIPPPPPPHIINFFPSWSVCLQRKNAENLKQIFPEKEYRGLSPNFHIHVSVSEIYISTMGLPFLLEEICGPILGIYKSLTDTWMWKVGLRPRYSQKRNI